MERSATSNPVFFLEIQEVIDKLKEKGCGKLIECLMDNEAECYTKKGRLNKSATCRITGLKTKELEDMLKQMREILCQEYEAD